MPTIEQSVEIAASPQTVWSIISDPTMTPKIFPDIVSAKIEPPGPAAIGQKSTLVMKVRGRRSEGTFETTEVVANEKLSIRQVSGSLLKKYDSTLGLTPTKRGTRVTETVEFEPAAGFLGKVLSVAVINRAVRTNVNASLKNVKELAELKELPSTKS
jgi:carbon monoxide dehydrogenase subunit G